MAIMQLWETMISELTILFSQRQTDSNNVLIINNLIKSSGYTILNDTNNVVRIKGAKIGLIGIITKGRHPDMVHGDLRKGNIRTGQRRS